MNPHCASSCRSARLSLCAGWLPLLMLSLQAVSALGSQTIRHWAFIPPSRPEIPATENEQWVQSPIDAFVLKRLEENHLEPAPEADRVILLRRLYLDLIGLPPTIEETETFLSDASPGAWQRLVYRLLNSPHYGERWGRHWLDAARYADSDGYEKDMSRVMWPYRDYVVRSFNQDKPYDRFIIEQLAGDLLPHPTQDQIVATGFLRNSMLNKEGAIDPEQFRMEAMFDRMDAIGKSILGITIQCAQCHDHKYDPISQEEYYRLFAYINNDHEAQPAVYTRDQQEQVDQIIQSIREIESDLKTRNPDWRERMADWERQVKTDQPEWTVLTELEQEGDKAQRYAVLPDRSLLAQGYAPTKFTQWFRTTNEWTRVTAFRLELLTDPNLPYGGPGRSFQGTCALSDFFVETIDPSNPEIKTKVKWSSASADYNQPERPLEINYDDRSTNNRVTGPISYAIDGDPLTAWGIDAGPALRNQSRKAVFVTESPAGFAGGTIWRIGLQQNHGGWNSDDHMNNNLGRFRISVTSTQREISADPLPRKVRRLLSIPSEERNASQEDAIFSFWRTTFPEWRTENEAIAALYDQWPSPASSLTLMERDRPRDTFLLRRGDWLSPAKEVSPGVPAFLHELPDDAPPTRLGLAQWLVDEQSPTTARVFVNRIWQAYFGTGLVETPEDLGTQSENPSHPDLLDWLACEFMDSGWSIKHIHRLILHSSTYRQSSHLTPERHQKDPNNRLLARGARFRVGGEIVRDIALAASGLLNPKMGGPSIMPPAPEFLFQPPASYAPFPWKHQDGPEQYRRALYTFRRRSTPYPMLQTFDVPNADFSCVRRQTSNTALQALVSLNEPIFVDCARALAKSALLFGGPSDTEKLIYAFRRTLTRYPSPDELSVLHGVLEKQRARLESGEVDPRKVATGESDRETQTTFPDNVAIEEWAAYTVAARVLLNLDETITRE